MKYLKSKLLIWIIAYNCQLSITLPTGDRNINENITTLENDVSQTSSTTDKNITSPIVNNTADQKISNTKAENCTCIEKLASTGNNSQSINNKTILTSNIVPRDAANNEDYNKENKNYNSEENSMVERSENTTQKYSENDKSIEKNNKNSTTEKKELVPRITETSSNLTNENINAIAEKKFAVVTDLTEEENKNDDSGNDGKRSIKENVNETFSSSEENETTSFTSEGSMIIADRAVNFSSTINDSILTEESGSKENSHNDQVKLQKESIADEESKDPMNLENLKNKFASILSERSSEPRETRIDLTTLNNSAVLENGSITENIPISNANENELTEKSLKTAGDNINLSEEKNSISTENPITQNKDVQIENKEKESINEIKSKNDINPTTQEYEDGKEPSITERSAVITNNENTTKENNHTDSTVEKSRVDNENTNSGSMEEDSITENKHNDSNKALTETILATRINTEISQASVNDKINITHEQNSKVTEKPKFEENKNVQSENEQREIVVEKLSEDNANSSEVISDTQLNVNKRSSPMANENTEDISESNSSAAKDNLNVKSLNFRKDTITENNSKDDTNSTTNSTESVSLIEERSPATTDESFNAETDIIEKSFTGENNTPQSVNTGESLVSATVKSEATKAKDDMEQRDLVVIENTEHVEITNTVNNTDSSQSLTKIVSHNSDDKNMTETENEESGFGVIMRAGNDAVTSMGDAIDDVLNDTHSLFSTALYVGGRILDSLVSVSLDKSLNEKNNIKENEENLSENKTENNLTLRYKEITENEITNKNSNGFLRALNPWRNSDDSDSEEKATAEAAGGFLQGFFPEIM